MIPTEGWMQYLLGYALGALFCLVVGAFVVWQLRLGFTKGYVHNQSGYRVERAKTPIRFWVNVVGQLITLAILGVILVAVIVFAITKPG
jgi:hypothetical protein